MNEIWTLRANFAAESDVSSQDCYLMQISWKLRLSLLVDKYVTGPFLNGIVQILQFFFVWLDKVTGNEIPAISDEEALQEHRNGMTLSIDNVPDEFKGLFPLAINWVLAMMPFEVMLQTLQLSRTNKS
jgi:hypothetical protein